MKAHTCSTAFMIAIVACLLLMRPVVWAQPPKPGGTLQVAYEADVTGLDPHLSPGLQAWHEEKAFDAPYYSMVDTVDIVDAHTVKCSLKHPSMTLLPVMAANRAGFLQMSPASYITHGAEPSLPTIATIIKTQLAHIGVEATVEVLDRPIFLKKLTSANPADRDWDQMINFTGSSVDAYTRSFLLDSRGTNQVNHHDPKIDALWDQLKQAPTPEEFSRLSQEVQRYVVRNMVRISATTLPFIQAARDHVKGYVFERGFKIRFESTWLDKP